MTTTTTTTFQQLGLSAEIIKALKENGFEAPFPIQEEAIPFILKGVDVIGQAHTGTGKTAAFFATYTNKGKAQWPNTGTDTSANKGTSSTGNN